MGKNKLKRFAENATFDHVFQPAQKELVGVDHEMKGKWNEFFKNNHPITLELGCGGGEYTVDLAKRYPERNYIGIDIKGARLWKGARIAKDNGINNIAFIRTRIHNISSFFTEGEKINELWITFPDPQPRDGKSNKRLTSSEYLERYRKFCTSDCIVNLKTDSAFLYNYTLNEVIKDGELTLLQKSEDVYVDFTSGPLVEVQTFYEKMWLKDGLKIHYLQWKLFK